MEISSKIYKALELGVTNNGVIPFTELCTTEDITLRILNYMTSQLKDVLSFIDESLEIKREDSFFKLDSANIEQSLSKIKEFIEDENTFVIFESEERTDILICLFLANYSALNTEQLVELLHFSRSTILDDISKVKQILHLYDIEITFDVSLKKYSITGDEIRIRAVFLYYYSKLSIDCQSAQKFVNSLLISNEAQLDNILLALNKICDFAKISFTITDLYNLAIIIYLFSNQKLNINLTENSKSKLKLENLYVAVDMFFKGVSEDEKIYITIHLLSTPIQLEKIAGSPVKDFVSISKKLIKAFVKLTKLEISDQKSLTKLLSQHFQRSAIRLEFGTYIGNPLESEIRQKYKMIFQAIKTIVATNIQLFEFPISDSEIAYLVLYFQAFSIEKTYSPKILLVCPQNVATSYLLRKEVLELLPNCNIVGISSIEGINQFDFDFIVTTVGLDLPYPYVRVNPILSNYDKKRLNYLNSIFQKDALSEGINKTSSLYDLNTIILSAKKEFKSSKLIDKFIDESLIQITNETLNWKEAIKLASTPLKSQAIFSDIYVKAMIDNIEKFGDYIIVGNDTAIAHANPTPDIKRVGLSYLKINKGCQIRKKSFYHLFIICTPDNNAHLELLTEVFQTISNSQIMKDIYQANEIETIFNLLVK